MVIGRTLKGIREGGGRCSARPLRDSAFCFFHDPEHVAEAAEARRLGGLRRKREGTIKGGLRHQRCPPQSEDLQRILDMAITDAVSPDNSMPGVEAGAKLLETSDLAARIEDIEAVLGPSSLEQGRRKKR